MPPAGLTASTLGFPGPFSAQEPERCFYKEKTQLIGLPWTSFPHGVQWLRLRVSKAGGAGSNPGLRTKISQAPCCGKNKYMNENKIKIKKENHNSEHVTSTSSHLSGAHFTQALILYAGCEARHVPLWPLSCPSPCRTLTHFSGRTGLSQAPKWVKLFPALGPLHVLPSCPECPFRSLPSEQIFSFQLSG